MRKNIVSGTGILACLVLLLAPQVIAQVKYKSFADINVSMDAPWSVTSADGEFPIVVYINQGNLKPVTLKRITVTNLSSSKVAEYPGPDITIASQFFMYVFDKDILGNPLTPQSFGSYSSHDSVDIFVKVELANDVKYGGIYKKHLQIYVAEPLPWLANWYPGDTHFHSDFTANLLEWGAGLINSGSYTGAAIVKRMGKAIGLKWTTITDHSCDFGDDLNTPIGNEALQWKDMEGICLSENANDDSFKILPAEEITTSILGGVFGRLHLLAYDIHGYVDGPEIPITLYGQHIPFSDHWADSLIPISDALHNVYIANAGSSFCFAAHPKAKSEIGLLLSAWPSSAYTTGLANSSFKGLELWNTRKRKENSITPRNVNPFPWKILPITNWHTELMTGITQWDKLLCQNLNPLRKIVIEGGSDAHGDFNYSTTSIITNTANDNALGIVRTYIYSENGLNEESILSSLKEGHSIVTDGPLVIFGIDNNGDSELGTEDVIPGDECSIPIKSSTKFLVKWATNTRFRDVENGRVNKINVVWGNKVGGTTPKVSAAPAFGNSYEWTPPQPLSPERRYYRVEARVGDAAGTVYYRAFTNPIWINWIPPIAVPAISWLRINSGDLSTLNRIVTLNNACTKSPTKYRASEKSDFSNATWLSYSTAPRFTITSAGNGTKKIYFQTKNSLGLSPVKNDIITLNEKVPTITSFYINNGDLTTTSRNVTLNNTTSKYPLYYRASERSDFSGADWKDYSTKPSFDIISSGDGEKTIYFQVQNGTGESAVASDKIVLGTSSGEMNWTKKNPSSKPSGRYAHAMAYDAARGQVVLFGGAIGIYHNDETWVWDGSNWLQKFPSSKPSGRNDAAMAYDAARGQVVLFGGWTDSGQYNDETWVWGGSNWTKKNPSSKPSGRFTHAMAYDAARSQVVLFGGDTSTGVSDETWVWGGSNWTKKNPSSKPGGGYGNPLAYDAARSQVVLFGGDTSTYNNDETWVWDGSNWTQKNPSSNLDGRCDHAMAYDAARGQVVLFGGYYGIGNLLGDTWVWDGSNWTWKSPKSAPSGRIAHAMAYDAARGQVVLFGGDDGWYSDETWVWGPSSTSLSKRLREDEK